MMEPLLIGEAYYRLEPLGYLIDNPVTLKLISKSYSLYGMIDLNVIPCDSTGNEEPPEEMLPDGPEDLLNQQIDFIVEI